MAWMLGDSWSMKGIFGYDRSSECWCRTRKVYGIHISRQCCRWRRQCACFWQSLQRQVFRSMLWFCHQFVQLSVEGLSRIGMLFWNMGSHKIIEFTFLKIIVCGARIGCSCTGNDTRQFVQHISYGLEFPCYPLLWHTIACSLIENPFAVFHCFGGASCFLHSSSVRN